uniref:[histone H3]-lysine(36) N-trimethyltransferase n=1 Tax=Myripristis murdjan TaxID=586833 RepID=A0A667ZXC8_9TELE
YSHPTMEGLSKAALMKSLSPRVMLSNRLLPKGTKMKVNLEEQGRQKVSFSFTQTKKSLQSPLFVPPSPDKSLPEPPSASPLATSVPQDKVGQNTDSKTEKKQSSVVPTSTAETLSPQTSVSLAPKSKTDLSKMHFKKQILSSSVTEEKPTSSTVSQESHSSEVLIKSSSKSGTEFPTPQPQNNISDCPSENAHTEASETRVTLSLKKSTDSSGKDGESSSATEQDKVYKRKTRSQSDSVPSESDGDSVHMSSSHKSSESTSKTKSDSRSKEVKKSSSGSNVEEKEKSSSKRSENRERSSSYSKSDRDSRHTSLRSSRSDKDRRRSRSRSRSRSRGSRTSSSHSRSERSRGERGSRSDRSYYHDSDRRSRRSSPRRERRSSRSRTERTRDSSDSEEDHRKNRTRTSDSSRSSTHSSSQKDSKSSSYLKSDKDSKSVNSPHSSEVDKRTQSSSKSERASRRTSDSDCQHKCSPEPNYHKSTTHHKSETNVKSAHSSLNTQSQTYERRRQKSSSSDSEADHKGKSQASDRSSVSEETCKTSQKKTSKPDSKHMTPSKASTKTSVIERQSKDTFHSPSKISTHLSPAEKSDSQLDGTCQRKEQDSKDVKEMVPYLDKNFQEQSSKRIKETSSNIENENKKALPITSENTSSGSLMHAKVSQENLPIVKDSLCSNNLPHVDSNAAVLNLCSSNDSVLSSQDKTFVQCSSGPKSLIAAENSHVTDHVQQDTKPDNIQLNKYVMINIQPCTGTSVKSDSSRLEPENQLTHTSAQQNTGSLKKSNSNTKKSRWDIVGQDTSDSDNSQMIFTTESKPTVKKVISVKKIEFSKDISQQESSGIKDEIRKEPDTHSIVMKQEEISKQEINSDSISVKGACEDQSELLQAGTRDERSVSKPTVEQTTNIGEPLHINSTLQDVEKVTKMESWNGEGPEEKSKESAHKIKPGKRKSLNQDGSGGQSEASDSEDSEYDSDCGEAIKRLHSVVVVPKNSSLTLDTQDTGAPSSSPMSSSELQHANQAADLNISEVPTQVSSQQRQESALTVCEETSGAYASVHASPHDSTLCQSQSNMIDSTSQSEGPPYKTGNNSAPERPKISATMNQSSSHCLENSRPSEQGHKQHYVSGRDGRMHSHYQHDDFSSADEINKKNGFNLSWDFSQPEQPSSTYQLPDSSHGPQLLNSKQTGISPSGQGYVQNNVSWNHQPSVMQTSRQPYLHMLEHYQDPAGEVHPDSLTNDHEDDSGDKALRLSKIAVECNGPSTLRSPSFVQGHEISSNTRGSASEGSVLPDPPREETLRPHKGRGPPKKRRPEIESDSDNEAEPGPAVKRERQDTDVSKETSVKAEVYRPLLTLQDFQDANKWRELAKAKKMPPYFDLIEENLYLTERKKNKSHRDIKRMQCECSVLSRDERSRGVLACGEDCLNRLLMIECSSRCLNGVYCSNRRFQMKQHADFEVILTEDKGWGLRAAKDLSPNTFVLEYCGEVLDHKEFKTRVKEYARNKNIHYYFMSLKNNEIIDATLKGNCSRFMNHSCEPNCETQKWTVNGQLRVGFFTTKAVTAGTELTFDYQFQRYGKEAQKCFCGAPSCRGFLGGENRVSVRAAGGKMKKDRSRKKDTVDEELEALLENGEGLYDEKEVVSLCRLMVRVETIEQRLICLKLIQNTQNPSCLKQFLDHHGLSLLWIFMVELSEAKGNSANNIKLQFEIMKTLAVLPISTKNMLEESRVLTFIQRWAQTHTLPQPAEMDGYSSESTSRAQTPLNTPDGSSTKLGPELDNDTPKRAVYRRLKIISENSLDSALSDASKASDGKEEEEEEEDDEEEDESSRTGLPDQPGESNTDIPVTSETPDASIASEATVAPTEPSVVGTPSQDEEEGVSDVESERSQEPQLSAVDISGMAARLLESWKDLKVSISKHDRSRDRDTALTPRTPSGSREPSEKTPRSMERRRRRSTSPPPSSYERSSRRTEERFDPSNSTKTPRVVGGKDRNKLSTEERRKLFEQEVAQREAQKQQQLQQQQQQQLQTMAYDPTLAYATSPGFITYPPGYPIQTFVDPTNPNAGKVLLPTPSVEPMVTTLNYEQTPSQPHISELGLPSPSSTSQAPPVSNLSQHITTNPLELTPGTPQQYTQSTVAAQDTGVAVLSVPAQTAPQVQGQQSYTTLWDPTTQQAVTVQTQPAQQYAAAPAQAQTQTAIYYQGQPCQTIYSIPTAYPQANTPVIQVGSHAPSPTASYLHGQPVYTGHQQGVVVQQGGTVTTIVTSQTVQQEMIVPNNVIDLPPPSPPKPKTIVLPPSWKVARDPEGKIYYYHVVTRQTQWDPPTWEGSSDNTSVDHESEMDLGTPTYDENPSKFSTKTAEADTSSELAKKSKETFRKEMSQFIVQCLNPYRKPDCKFGRISNTDDFKHLARKLTHGVMNKELKACKNPEDLECNENVKHKTKEYIKKYMQRFGSVYRPKEDTEVD